MSKPWFDPDSGTLLFDEYVQEMPSFQKIMADQTVTSEEFAAQAQKVVALFQQLEGQLSPEAKETATQALCELAVLNTLHAIQMTSR